MKGMSASGNHDGSAREGAARRDHTRATPTPDSMPGTRFLRWVSASISALTHSIRLGQGSPHGSIHVAGLRCLAASGFSQFNCHRSRFPAANANCRNSALASGCPQCADQRHDDSGARGTDRMT